MAFLLLLFSKHVIDSDASASLKFLYSRFFFQKKKDSIEYYRKWQFLCLVIRRNWTVSWYKRYRVRDLRKIRGYFFLSSTAIISRTFNSLSIITSHDNSIYFIKYAISFKYHWKFRLWQNDYWKYYTFLIKMLLIL